MPAMNAEQAIAALRETVKSLMEGDGQFPDKIEELLRDTAPENLVERYNPLQTKADRYDAILRWFKNDLKYKMSVGEDEDLGVAIDEKIDEEEEAREQRRKAREAAGQ